METLSSTHEKLKEYYGKILKGSGDLKTNACCCSENSMPPQVRAILDEIDEEITARFYGCGSPLPPLLEGCTVLDLGCGTGRDAFIASKLVGEKGRVIGVDMTDEQIGIAEKHVDSMMRKFGYKEPNIRFAKGYIEDLQAIGIEDSTVDVVISNCVINLSPDKPAVFEEIFRVLRPGGELYFSDVFAGRRVPDHLREDPVLRGECLAGAMYIEDFRRMLDRLGCPDYRIVSRSPISLDDPEITEKIGMVDFYSMTVRAFKLDDLEDICEDYGQAAVYEGTIPGHPHYFDLDDQHRFATGKANPVCGNTASMIQRTRFADHFRVIGDRSVHYGPFDCSPAADEPGGCCSSGCCD